MEKIIQEKYGNTGGIFVIKNGETVFENYYNKCTKDSTFHIFSVTKSIMSILIGIAMDQGYVKSLDQRVLEFFPDYVMKRGEKILPTLTLRDFLTMMVPYKYKFVPYTAFFSSESWVKASLDLAGGRGKGTGERKREFRYAPLIGPDVISGILTSATGQSVLAFAQKNLFEPLQINVPDSVIFRTKQEQLDWYKEKNTMGWIADGMGVNTAAWGLSLTTADMAKIGQLYLNGGNWNERQIVSREWILESTREQSYCKQFSSAYGYLWWVIDSKERCYAAMGDGGNVIYVNESKGLVIAIASFFKPRAADRIAFIKDVLVPMFE